MTILFPLVIKVIRKAFYRLKLILHCKVQLFRPRYIIINMIINPVIKMTGVQQNKDLPK